MCTVYNTHCFVVSYDASFFRRCDNVYGLAIPIPSKAQKRIEKKRGEEGKDKNASRIIGLHLRTCTIV